jgi:hypothetical protein
VTITHFEIELGLILLGFAFLLGAAFVAGGLASDFVLRRARRAAVRHRARLRDRKADR